ncbi:MULTISPECIES: hypothetical protein [unclassified Janthinobacterium]|uniref:hypothetical protein n=1 Tax=unclassified Janthinobacterium TaxID=2610881 RepID=UPI001E418903|nr:MULTISPECIES: hypothetical protein [unclassified Janthinobacterium]MCC7644983.1 hypothetical protein [Janthinobacterium sp. EB271-G4-3-1]MCC7694459.1 hypothetical protein [Janthinobacterium sp. EB271-G4-3-2]
MDICNKCKTGLWTVVSHCPYCGHAVAGAAKPAAAVPPPLPVSPPVAPKPPPVPVAPAPAPKAVPKPAVVPPPAPPKPVQPQAAPKPAPAAPPASTEQPSPPRKWLRWLGGIVVLAAVIVYMNGKPGGKNESACNDAIDSGLKLVANGSLDGARQKLATAKNVCTGKSSAKADDLQAAIGKAGAASSGCQRGVRAIERAIDGHQLQSAAKGIAALDIDCAGASSVDSLRKQLARQQAAAASVLVGVRQALDGKDAVAARNSIARLEAIDREAVELPQLKADVQALSATAAPAPAPVSTPAVVPAPAQQEPAPARVVERSAVAERRPLETSPVDSGAAMRNEMAQSFLHDAERSLLEGKFDAAKTYLESARRVDPGNARIDNLSRRIRERERQVLQTETTIN